MSVSTINYELLSDTGAVTGLRNSQLNSRMSKKIKDIFFLAFYPFQIPDRTVPCYTAMCCAV